MKSFADPRHQAAILRRLRTIAPTTRARWGRMSAHQMICHLSDAACMALGTRTVAPATTWSNRTVVKWIALYAPFNWPPGIQTVPEVDQEGGGTKPSTFAADFAILESLIARMVEPRRSPWPPHPIFGRMSERDWMLWAYRHMDHHLRQFGA